MRDLEVSDLIRIFSGDDLGGEDDRVTYDDDDDDFEEDFDDDDFEEDLDEVEDEDEE